jgi:hypothetical protein
MSSYSLNRRYGAHPVYWTDEVTHLNTLIEEHICLHRQVTRPYVSILSVTMMLLVAISSGAMILLVLRLGVVYVPLLRGPMVLNTIVVRVPASSIVAVPAPAPPTYWSVTKLAPWAYMNGAGALWKLVSYVPISTYQNLLHSTKAAFNVWRVMAGLFALSACVLMTSAR